VAPSFSKINNPMKTISELSKYLKTINKPHEPYKIAVGSLIFKNNGYVILLERGTKARDEIGMLEGVGGGVDDEQNLHEALFREVKEELGDDVKIRIDELLTVMVLPGENFPFWVVPVYLCKLESGIPRIMEPEKCSKMHYLKLSEIDREKLSRFQRETMRAYNKRYGNEPYYKQNHIPIK